MCEDRIWGDGFVGEGPARTGVLGRPALPRSPTAREPAAWPPAAFPQTCVARPRRDRRRRKAGEVSAAPPAAAGAASLDNVGMRAGGSQHGVDDQVSSSELRRFAHDQREIDFARSADRSLPIARLCVGVATRGRPVEVQTLVERLRQQTLRPQAIVIACVCESDVGALKESDELKILPDPAGRANATECSTISLTTASSFFDDDFLAETGLAARRR